MWIIKHNKPMEYKLFKQIIDWQIAHSQKLFNNM